MRLTFIADCISGDIPLAVAAGRLLPFPVDFFADGIVLDRVAGVYGEINSVLW